jgi:hypothetical protein
MFGAGARAFLRTRGKDASNLEVTGGATAISLTTTVHFLTGRYMFILFLSYFSWRIYVALSSFPVKLLTSLARLCFTVA